MRVHIGSEKNGSSLYDHNPSSLRLDSGYADCGGDGGRRAGMIDDKFTCDICGKRFDIDDLGFLGTSDNSADCSPFTELDCRCVDCEQKKRYNTK